MKEIPLRNKSGDVVACAIVDDEDYEWLVGQGRWRLLSGYASRNFHEEKIAKTINMHRFIMNPPKGAFVDHINQNKLDNRRENLRICNKAQNSMNRGLQSNSSTGYRGVHKTRIKDRFDAKIKIDQKSIYLGRYSSPETAARAYDKKAREIFREFATLNFPGEAVQVNERGDNENAD